MLPSVQPEEARALGSGIIPLGRGQRIPAIHDEPAIGTCIREALKAAAHPRMRALSRSGVIRKALAW